MMYSTDPLYDIHSWVIDCCCEHVTLPSSSLASISSTHAALHSSALGIANRLESKFWAWFVRGFKEEIQRVEWQVVDDRKWRSVGGALWFFWRVGG